MPRDPLEHIQLFEASGPNLNSRRSWYAIWLAVIYGIWAHRNDIVFNGALVCVQNVFDLVKLKSWLWLKHLSKNFAVSFFKWESNPRICISSIEGRCCEV